MKPYRVDVIYNDGEETQEFFNDIHNAEWEYDICCMGCNEEDIAIVYLLHRGVVIKKFFS
jgi:hypothetical protein